MKREVATHSRHPPTFFPSFIFSFFLLLTILLLVSSKNNILLLFPLFQLLSNLSYPLISSKENQHRIISFKIWNKIETNFRLYYLWMKVFNLFFFQVLIYFLPRTIYFIFFNHIYVVIFLKKLQFLGEKLNRAVFRNRVRFSGSSGSERFIPVWTDFWPV
jgi:hypothetical protein